MATDDPLELAAIDRGAGPAVVLVHGGVFHAAPAWAKNIGPLVEAGYRVIAIDRRGHGRSPAGDADFIPLHLHADDLRLTLELRDVQRASLAGVSYGALVCLEFALSWPERVDALILLEPPLFTLLQDDPDYAVWFERFEDIAGRAGTMKLEEWLREWMSLIDQRLTRGIDTASPTWRIIECQAPLILKEEAGWQWQPGPDALAELTTPTLVINGGESEPAMDEIARRLTNLLSNAVHRRVPGGGHDLHARMPQVFNSLLLEFLEANQIATEQ